MQQGLIKTSNINIRDQQADLLTKALRRSQHELLLAKLDVLNIFNISSLRWKIKYRDMND